MKKNYVGLLKFGQKEHMDAFFGNGELYLNTFDYFKNLEDVGDGRADSCEYLFSLYSGTGVENLQLTINPSDGIAFKPIVLNKNSIASVKLDCPDKKYSHLFCLSAVDVDWTQQNKQLVDRRNVADGKDWVVFIKNPNTFRDRLFEYFRAYNLSAEAHFIEYIDPDNHCGGMGCFKKFNSYAYQNEWRVAVRYKNTTEPQKIILGSLADIAYEPVYAPDLYSGPVDIVVNEVKK